MGNPQIDGLLDVTYCVIAKLLFAFEERILGIECTWKNQLKEAKN
jgi:hypothetical protein